MGHFCHFCPCQKVRPSLTEEGVQRVYNKRDLDALKRHYILEKKSSVIEKRECEWWRLCKTVNNGKQHNREKFRYKLSLTENQLIKKQEI